MFVKYAGVSQDTAELIEYFRESPTETDDEIFRKCLSKLKDFDRVWKQKGYPESDSKDVGNGQIGCDLGKGVVLQEGEKLYCFRYRPSLDARKPEGVALATNGKLVIEGQEVRPSRGSLVQPALKIIQRKIGDHSPTTGQLISLDAWKYWYVERDGKFVRVGDLRDPDKIRKRNRHHYISEQEREQIRRSKLSLDDF